MFKLITATITLIIVSLFIFLNSNQRVVLNFLFIKLNDVPLALACLLFFIIGLTLSIPLFLADRFSLIKKQKLESRRLNVHLESSRKEIKNLEQKIKLLEDKKSKP